MRCSLEQQTLVVGARGSKLSRRQFEEVQKALCDQNQNLVLEPLWIDTSGDIDKITSLRTLDKTDFFTREIDRALIEGRCRFAVHSAKDLPCPIPDELSIVAVTKGLDSSDSLVFREKNALETLPIGAKIATSSLQRELRVKELREDFQVVDLRGTIEERLKKLESKEVDGVVVAEAALIRLNLNNLPRVSLPGFSTPGQGQLAILARVRDHEMENLFAPIDCRKKVLYLGLRKPEEEIRSKYIYCPVIAVKQRSFLESDIQQAFLNLTQATHFLFTSQTAVGLFFEALKESDLPDSLLHGKMIFAVGKKTASRIQAFGLKVDLVSPIETMEGLIEQIDAQGLPKSHFFWPHSALSRPLLKQYLIDCGHILTEAILYEAYPKKPGTLPHEADYDKILFTSPSTVDAFLHFFGRFPEKKDLQAIGTTTKNYLENTYKLRGVYEV